MSLGSSTESYSAFARIGLRENPGKNLNQERKSFDLHLNRIKEECLDQSSDFNSEINFEDIAMPNSVSVVKYETEEGNLQDMGLNAEAIDHSCLTSEIKVEEVAVPYFFEVKCEPQVTLNAVDLGLQEAQENQSEKLVCNSSFVATQFIMYTNASIYEDTKFKILLSKNMKVRIYKTVILPVVLYGCETWTLILKEEQRLRVFENKILRKIFEAKRDEVRGEWRKLHNAELHALYSSPDIIRNIKSRRLRWAGHVSRMGESRNAYRMLVGRPEGKRPLGRPRQRWEDNIKMDLREVGYDDRDRINLAQDRDQWRAYVRAAMNLWEKSHGLDTVKDDLTLDVMPLEDTVITDRSPIDRDKSVSSVSIDIPCEDRPTGCQGQDSFVSSGRIAGESFIECRDYETVFVSQNSLKSQPSSYNSFRSETLRNSNKCDICGKMMAISTALKYQLQLDLSENALKCDTCEISFPESTKNREHTRFLKNEKPFTCDVCEKDCSDSKALKRHMLKHTGKKSFKCSVCEKFFLTSGQLKMHVRKHTGEKPFKCDVCGKCFSQSGALKTHTRQHTGDKPFKCDECGMCFSNSTNLKTHARAHSGERPFKCLDCGKCFTQSGNLKIHARQHTGEKPFKCNICGKFFSYSETLQRHQSVHTSEKPFKCDVCGSFFSKSTNLKRHVRMHTGEKTFKCQDCEKCFWDLRRLKIHVRQHTGERPYMCDICGKRFLESGTLKTHSRKHTGDKPFKCRDCGKCYRESGHLKVHTRVHTGEKPFKCNVCGKCFSHSGILKVHERKHTGEKSFKCPVCGKCFWESSHLKMHSRMHTGEKPFKCHICGKCFSQSGNLKVHVRQHNDEK
ncbi:hypothetical protein ANN_27488 [Periplaneta americana]|uniref:C2H2-type domain-containing protein n=1 Tax=Periplaneta americana TaxID=6978 RepID=A0ABQ8RVX0_PERAM|nr:hypothetical protein ANN_27488 [Periplaneta americana]